MRCISITIISSSCAIEKNKEDERDDNAKRQYRRILDVLHQHSTTTNNIKFIFLALPIFDYKLENNNLIKQYSQETGYNLGDRLSIVFNYDDMFNQQGDYEYKDNVYACIRMSSNIVLYSYLKYCKILDINVDFKFQDVKQIG